MDFATADTTARNLIALGSLQADLGHVRNMLPALSISNQIRWSSSLPV